MANRTDLKTLRSEYSQLRRQAQQRLTRLEKADISVKAPKLPPLKEIGNRRQLNAAIKRAETVVSDSSYTVAGARAAAQVSREARAEAHRQAQARYASAHQQTIQRRQNLYKAAKAAGKKLGIVVKNNTEARQLWDLMSRNRTRRNAVQLTPENWKKEYKKIEKTLKRSRREYKYVADAAKKYGLNLKTNEEKRAFYEYIQYRQSMNLFDLKYNFDKWTDDYSQAYEEKGLTGGALINDFERFMHDRENALMDSAVSTGKYDMDIVENLWDQYMGE